MSQGTCRFGRGKNEQSVIHFALENFCKVTFDDDVSDSSFFRYKGREEDASDALHRAEQYSLEWVLL